MNAAERIGASHDRKLFQVDVLLVLLLYFAVGQNDVGERPFLVAPGVTFAPKADLHGLPILAFDVCEEK